MWAFVGVIDRFLQLDEVRSKRLLVFLQIRPDRHSIRRQRSSACGSVSGRSGTPSKKMASLRWLKYPSKMNSFQK